MAGYSKQWEFLKEKHANHQLSHAYIFSGQDIESLKKFAADFIAHIACKFPDVMTVRSADSKSSVTNEKDMLEITIEQIRGVQQFLAYKSYHGGYKAVIIENAERMNRDAQDSFLKNLEEPKGNTLIILLSPTPEILLPTISSRCQAIKFFAPRSLGEVGLGSELLKIIQADLAEKFQYAKNANLDGGEFEKILQELQHYWRKDIARNANILKLALDLESQVKISNINKKLALEILLLET